MSRRDAAREICWQGRKSIERNGSIACGVGAGVRDLDPVSCPQRARKRIALVEHVVAVARRARDHGVVDGVVVAVGPQPVADVLVLGFGEAAVATDVEVHPAPPVGTGARRHHLAVDSASRADDRPPGFHHELWWARTEIAVQRGHDGVGHQAELRRAGRVCDGEAAADVEGGEIAHGGEDRFSTTYSDLPCGGVELLGADMEAHPFRPKAQRPGIVKQVDGLGRSATELVAERGYRRRKRRCDTAFHAGPGGMLGDGCRTVVRVKGEPTHPDRERSSDVRRLLERVAERQKAAVDRGGGARVDLTYRGDVEGRALGRQQTQDGFGRIRLDRVADPRIGQCGVQGVVVLAHPTEMDGQIRRLGHTSQTSGASWPGGPVARSVRLGPLVCSRFASRPAW